MPVGEGYCLLEIVVPVIEGSACWRGLLPVRDCSTC